MSKHLKQSPRDRELYRNYAAYKASKAELILKHGKGKFLLMKDENVIEVFDTQADAIKYGKSKYSDGVFSVQGTASRPINLGFYSCH